MTQELLKENSREQPGDSPIILVQHRRAVHSG